MANNDIEKRKFTVKISKEEIEQHRNRLVDVDRQYLAKEAEAKSTMQALRAQLKQLKDERASILDAIDNGTEEREIDVIERWNWRLLKIEFVRTDTNKVVEERAMNADERQLELDAHGVKIHTDDRGKAKKGGRKGKPEARA